MSLAVDRIRAARAEICSSCGRDQTNREPHKPECSEMTPQYLSDQPAARFRRALQTCHWSVRHVAPLIQWDPRSISHWLSGRYEPPADVLAWIERLAAVHSANPPPERIRRGE